MPSKESGSKRRHKEHDRDKERLRDRESPRSQKPHRRRRSSPAVHYASSKRPYDVSRNVSDPQQPRESSSSRPSPQRRASGPDTFGMARRGSAGHTPERKASFPYPTFSKPHSRENVGSREQLSNPRLNIYTPEATDLGQSHSDNSRSPKVPPPMRTRSTGHAPPSPPLTNEEPDLRRARSGITMKQAADSGKAGLRKSYDGPRFSASRSDLREAEEGRRSPIVTSKASEASVTPTNKTARSPFAQAGANTFHGTSPTRNLQSRNVSEMKYTAGAARSATNSDATSVAPENRMGQKSSSWAPQNGVSRQSEYDSALKLPNDNHSKTASPQAVEDRFPPVEVFTSESEAEGAVHAEPPPPPALGTPGIPRVDYLLQNGGLPQTISKSFLSSSNLPPPSYLKYMSPNPSAPTQPAKPQTAFAPYYRHLEDLEKVISRSGSIAVATGYRSVARRLLDRLESVFARNISSEICECIICRTRRKEASVAEDDTGVSWGEVLELVSERRELPPWPPFSLPKSTAGLGLSDVERPPPMQNIDIDVPEELREHYLRQSKKAKQAVSEWLSNQPVEGPNPPTEADDETLAFAMLTYLDPEERRIFTALLRGLSTIPMSRAPTPATSGAKSDFMPKIAIALQRLYRLPKPPRESESCMFLLKNPELHNALATLSAISSAEWDILISGRFDGFLWSGAEDPSNETPTNTPSRGPTPATTPASRTTTPFNSAEGGGVPLPRVSGSSAQSTPNFGSMNASTTGFPQLGVTPSGSPTKSPGPVAMDEETEIAVLAEVEREIFQGMEALEDAFEALHLRAEAVRQALRERGAGLAAGARARRASAADLNRVEVRMGTPATQNNWDGAGFPSRNSSFDAAKSPPGINGVGFPNASPAIAGSDDGLFDERSELAPDDSASNVGHKESSRHRHRFRRRTKTRRTPAPVDEENESET